MVNGNGVASVDGLAPSDVAAPAAAEDAERPPSSPRAEHLTLSCGIVLGIRMVAPRLLRDASERIPIPPVPTFYNESKQRDEPNPDHPDYATAVARHRFEATEAALKVALIIGTTCESVPEGWYRPEHDGWIDEINEAHEILGTVPPPLRREGKARYLDWLLYYAATSDEDTFILTRVMLAQTLATEEEVSRALDAFRHTAERLRDLDLALAQSS